MTCKYHFETEPFLSVFEDIPFEHFSASYCIGADVVVGPVLACFLPFFSTRPSVTALLSRGTFAAVKFAEVRLKSIDETSLFAVFYTARV